jgi:hypothetical protein
MKCSAKRVLVICALAWVMVPMRAQDEMNPAPVSGDGVYVPDSGNETPPPESAAAGDGASFQTFYDSLASQGTWIQSGDYGYVWQPNVNDVNWAPYTAGHWVYTDDGWTWVSDEPWGWATYHYGRWVNLDGTGWCWVPGYAWAPAWVSWRYGDGYCGWAPLPPDSFVGIDYLGDGFSLEAGFHIGGDCDSFYGIGAGWYNFVPVTYLGYPNYRGYYARRQDNFAIINHTTNVTNINVTRNGASDALAGVGGNFGRVTTGGPSLAQVNAVSQTPVEQVHLVRTNQPGVGALTNHSLALYAPRLSPVTSSAVRPAFVAKPLGHSAINRGADITRPLAVNQRLVAPAPTAGEIESAQRAQFDAPARAKIVTANTEVQPILQAPLGSLKPAVAVPATTVPNAERAPGSPVTSPSYSYPGGGSGADRGNRPVESSPYAPSVVRPQTPSPSQPSIRPAPANPSPSHAPSGGSENERSLGGGGSGASAGNGGKQGAGGSYGGNSQQQKNH